MICANTKCSISYSCHQSVDCCYCCCWCTACCSHYWICFFILSHTVGEMLLLLLLLTLTGPTIGSAFARTTFLPRQLRCDLTDLVSTWHFLPLLLLFMTFWDQLMMKGLRSIFKVTFLPPLFQIISNWWGKTQCFFRLVLITNSLYLLNVLTGFPLTTVDKFDLNFLSFPSLLYCKPLEC